MGSMEVGVESVVIGRRATLWQLSAPAAPGCHDFLTRAPCPSAPAGFLNHKCMACCVSAESRQLLLLAASRLAHVVLCIVY